VKSRSGFPTGREKTKNKTKERDWRRNACRHRCFENFKPQSVTQNGTVAQCLSALVADRWADRPPRDRLVHDEDQMNSSRLLVSASR
jgi:hypothetical protein